MWQARCGDVRGTTGGRQGSGDIDEQLHDVFANCTICTSLDISADPAKAQRQMRANDRRGRDVHDQRGIGVHVSGVHLL